MTGGGTPRKPYLSPRRFAKLSPSGAGRYLRRLMGELLGRHRGAGADESTPSVPYILSILNEISSSRRFSPDVHEAAASLASLLEGRLENRPAEGLQAHLVADGELRRYTVILLEHLAVAGGIPLDDAPLLGGGDYPFRAEERDDRESPVLAVPVVVYAPHIRSPYNVGGIIRSAAAFGIAGVVFGRECPDPSHPRAVRTAMGAGGMTVVRRGDLDTAAALIAADENPGRVDPDGPAVTDVPVVVLETGGTDAYDTPYPPRGILVVGHEELGVPRSVLERSGDVRVVTIPHRGAKASLNVGVAAGIALALWDRSMRIQG